MPLVLDRSTQTTLTLICDLLAAGIATAELRRSLERAELERERLRLAALVHDSLAQDLALAVRELALLDTSPDPATAAASMARLREAVASAHGTVRARLKELLPPVPLGGVHETVGEVCAQFEDRGMDLRLEREGADLSVLPAASVVVVRVLTEALANAEKHASGCAVLVRVDTTGALVRLAIADAGPGFDVEQAPGRERGHFGLVLMRDRAREGGGELSVTSTAAGGTHVLLEVPV
jgi:signal transduction histidine kinase